MKLQSSKNLNLSNGDKIISVFCPDKSRVAAAFSASLAFAISDTKKRRILLLDLGDKLTLSNILTESPKDWTQIFGKQGSITDYISSTKLPNLDILASSKRRFSIWKMMLQDVFRSLVGGVKGEMLLKEKLEDEGVTNFYDKIIIVLPSEVDHAFIEGLLATDKLIFLADLEDEMLFAKSSTVLGIVNLVNQRYGRSVNIESVISLLEKNARKTSFTRSQVDLLKSFFLDRVDQNIWDYENSSKWIKDSLFSGNKKIKKQSNFFKKIAEELS